MNRKITKSKVDLTRVNKYFKNAPCFPKSHWPKEALANKALYDCRWCSNREQFIFMSRNHPKLNQFIEKFTEYDYVIKAEIDIIARKGDWLVVVEVKTRTSVDFGNPEDFVDKKKIKLLVKAIDEYVQETDLDLEIRFDIIAIVKNNTQYTIDHLEDAFYHF